MTNPAQLQLPPFTAIHAQNLVSVLEKFARYPKRLGDLQGEYYALEMWHETNAQKDHTIRRETTFPTAITAAQDNAVSAGQEPEAVSSPTPAVQNLILSGPHFFVGNPLNKTPRRSCTQNSHYDVIDLTMIPETICRALTMYLTVYPLIIVAAHLKFLGRAIDLSPISIVFFHGQC